MKIITFQGGLGNQIFEYANYMRLKAKFPDETFYGFYPSKGLKSHNGLEINQCFRLELPKSTNLSNVVGYVFYYLYRISFKFNIRIPFIANRFNPNDEAIYHADWFGDKKFLPDNFFLEFRIKKMSQENEKLLNFIKNHTTLAVHVRRGDFLSSKNFANYGGICTDDYYNKAINKIFEHKKDVHILFFSDDENYVRKHFYYNNMLVVNWNKGEESYLDMYIMSLCDYMIIANSTFSYWAAKFNRNAKMIISPKKWQNGKPVDIVPAEWLKM